MIVWLAGDMGPCGTMRGPLAPLTPLTLSPLITVFLFFPFCVRVWLADHTVQCTPDNNLLFFFYPS